MLNVEGVVLEPAGALAIDALKDFSKKEIRGKTIVAVVSGGNFDFERLPDVKERALRYRGPEEILHLPLPAAAGRAARLPRNCSGPTTTSPASNI